MGSPRQSPTSESPTQKKGKMTGSYQFPFSFPFPARINSDSYSTGQNTVPSSSLTADLSTSLSPPPSPFFYGEKENSRAFAPDPIRNQSSSPLRVQFGNLLPKRRPAPSQPKISSTIGSQGVFHPTPASFAMRDVGARVQYELLVRIVHGRFRPDSR